jgi:hypothetical protein
LRAARIQFQRPSTILGLTPPENSKTPPEPPKWWIERAFQPAGLSPEEQKQLNTVQMWQYMEERNTYYLLQAFDGLPNREPPKPPYKPKIEPTIDSPPLAP